MKKRFTEEQIVLILRDAETGQVMSAASTGFHPEFTGRENVFMQGAILGLSRHEILGSSSINR